MNYSINTNCSFIINKIILVFFVFFYFSCAAKKIDPKPDKNKTQAEKAFKEFEGSESTIGIENNFGTLNYVLEDTDKQAKERYNTGEPGWISIQKDKYFNSNTSFKNAKMDLITEMRNDAISQKVGTTVEITQLMSDVISEVGNEEFSKTAWSGFFKSTVSGIITNEKEIDSKIETKNDEVYQYFLQYDFYVEPVTGKRDVEYLVDAKLKENMLNEGDELEISVTPTKDSYVYIFNLMADNNSILMFPNDYMTENKIKAKEKLIIPDPSIKQYITFIVGSLPGHSITSESVYVICTKKDIPLPEHIPRIGEELITFSKDDNNFLSLQKWLNSIPLDERIESLSMYHISK